MKFNIFSCFVVVGFFTGENRQTKLDYVLVDWMRVVMNWIRGFWKCFHWRRRLVIFRDFMWASNQIDRLSPSDYSTNSFLLNRNLVQISLPRLQPPFCAPTTRKTISLLFVLYLGRPRFRSFRDPERFFLNYLISTRCFANSNHTETSETSNFVSSFNLFHFLCKREIFMRPKIVFFDG